VRFRAKIFLAIILPATLLVATSVAATIVRIRTRLETAVQAELDRSGSELEAILAEQFEQLKLWRKSFETPRFDAAITDAVESGEVATLKERLRDEFLVVKEPDFYEARGKKDAVLLRKSPVHSCTKECAHAVQPWMKDEKKKEVLTEFDGEPFLAVKVEPDKGLFVLGTRFRRFLEKLHKDFRVDLALLKDRQVVYSSLKEWSPSSGTEGSINVAGQRFLASRRTVPNSELNLVLLMYNVSAFDAEQARTLGFGAAGIAVAILIAALVSSFVSRGVSQPVERLVDATRKIAAGDYAVKVDVSGRDEIGRLAEAFNEMTVGLRKRQEIMEKTLSRDVAEEFLKGGTERGGERRVITIVFMDVRGYTSGTEGMDPADVVVMLNELMDLLASAIERHGGLVNKFLGDGLMAMFGAPKLLEDHAFHAVQAGIEMQKQMERWNHRRTARGLASFYSGIGINTGEVVCGKVGGRSRLEYTLIGEEVNLASRICGKAAPRQVLITKQTRDKLGDRVQVKELEPVVVKGLSYPIKIFEALG
jgi:class 3 adenylate cyclase